MKYKYQFGHKIPISVCCNTNQVHFYKAKSFQVSCLYTLDTFICKQGGYDVSFSFVILLSTYLIDLLATISKKFLIVSNLQPSSLLLFCQVPQLIFLAKKNYQALSKHISNLAKNIHSNINRGNRTQFLLNKRPELDFWHQMKMPPGYEPICSPQSSPPPTIQQHLGFVFFLHCTCLK